MGIKDEEKTDNYQINEQIYNKIAHFLGPAKRKSVMDILNKKGQLSQGELATAVDSSATSLANILSKFDQFEYKLLEAKNAGKYRFYALSELGKAYVNYTKEGADRESDREEIAKNEDEELFWNAKKSLDEFKVKYPETWQVNLDDALCERVRGCGRLLDEESELLVDQYLKCLELLTLQENHTTLDQVLALLLDDAILRHRVEAFMNYFDPFVVVLKNLKDKRKTYTICKLVKAALDKQNEKEEEVKTLLEEGEWKSEEYEKLKDMLEVLEKCVAGYNEEEIYQYFNRLLPDQEILSAHIVLYLRSGNR